MNIKLKKFLAVLRRPVFFIVINFFLVNTLFSLLPYNVGNTVYNIGRISIIFYAGWLVARKNVGGIWQAAAAGIVIYFIDHVVIKGAIFLLNYVFKPEGLGLAALGGVIVSFVMFIPLSMLIAAIGCMMAGKRKPTAPMA